MTEVSSLLRSLHLTRKSQTSCIQITDQGGCLKILTIILIKWTRLRAQREKSENILSEGNGEIITIFKNIFCSCIKKLPGGFKRCWGSKIEEIRQKRCRRWCCSCRWTFRGGRWIKTFRQLASFGRVTKPLPLLLQFPGKNFFSLF